MGAKGLEKLHVNGRLGSLPLATSIVFSTFLTFLAHCSWVFSVPQISLQVDLAKWDQAKVQRFSFSFLCDCAVGIVVHVPERRHVLGGTTEQDHGPHWPNGPEMRITVARIAGLLETIS